MKFNPMSLQNNFHNFYESKNQASNQKPKKKKRKKTIIKTPSFVSPPSTFPF